MEFLNCLSNQTVTVPCGLLICSLGFESVLLEGLPRTEDGRLKMTDWCRVPEERASVYTTGKSSLRHSHPSSLQATVYLGWCAGVARGVIAESQNQSFAVVDEMLHDWENGRIRRNPKAQGAKHLLTQRNVRYITWEDWKYIDECERKAGAKLGKPREKLIDYRSLLDSRDDQG